MKNSFLFDLSKILNLLLVTLCFFIIYFTGGFLFLSTFLTCIFYVVILFGILRLYISLKKEGKNTQTNRSFVFIVFSNTILLLIILLLFSVLSYYQPPKYIKTVFKLNVSSIRINEINYKSYYIANMPTGYSINNYLYRRFWEYNIIGKKAKENDLIPNSEINKIKQNKSNFLTKIFSIKEKELIPFFIKDNKYNEYKVINKKFDIFNIITTLSLFNDLSSDYIQDKSLLDSFIIKSKNGDKKMCYIKDIDPFFYNNQFELFIENDKVIFNTLYILPNINFEENINKIIKGCQ